MAQKFINEIAQSGFTHLLELIGYLPPYSPDFNPIEMALSKFKALLKKADAKTIDDLWKLIGSLIGKFISKECKNHFKAAVYEQH